MANEMENKFNYLIKIVSEQGERFFLKSQIDETKMKIKVELTNLKQSWKGKMIQDEIIEMARKFPKESKDTFYSHTHSAFSRAKRSEINGHSYVFSCKRLDRTHIELVWKEKIDDLNSLKTIGSIKLEENSNEETVEGLLDYSIEEMINHQSIVDQQNKEILRMNEQLKKAVQTIEKTVDLKERLEDDLYRKFVLVLNKKKEKLLDLKREIENNHQDSNHSRENQQTIENEQISSLENRTNLRRSIDEIQEENTTDDELLDQEHHFNRKITKKVKIDENEGSLLDLGDDQIDMSRSVIKKHPQRRVDPVVEKKSKKSFVPSQSTHSQTGSIQSLPDESQTTEDLIGKI